MTHAAFDVQAARYDELWTHAETGRLQREAVWRIWRPLFVAGSTVLDLGCGTGEDALRFQRTGVNVRAIDASPEMVRIAQHRGVDASVLRIEEIAKIEGTVDGVVSNFGPLNCVENLKLLRAPLARLVQPGGHLALCVLGRFCAWEVAYYLGRGRVSKALRRLKRSVYVRSLGIRIYYHSVHQIRKAFEPDFAIVQVAGVGLFVPPSYIRTLPAARLAAADRADRRLASLPFARALADHRLIVLARNS